MADVFLMSPPRPDWRIRGRANVFSTTHGREEPVQPGDALRDWIRLAFAIEEAGGHVLVLPPPEDSSLLTGLPYTAESGLWLRDEDDKPTFLLPNLKPPHRRAEREHIARFVEDDLGWKTLDVPGFWEGQGDTLRMDENRVIHTYGVGEAARTEAAAYRAIASRVSPEHVQIRFRAEPWFHGNTFLGIYWDASSGAPSLLLCREALDPPEEEKLRQFVGDIPIQTISRQESLQYATNALQVGRTVIAPPGLPSPICAFFQERGLEIRELPLDTLFSKGGGAGVCLTNRLVGLAPSEIPAQFRLGEQLSRLRLAIPSLPR